MWNKHAVSRSSRVVLWLQGIYCIVIGVWPLLQLSSFLAVTGPKHDLWLVQTMGALIAVVGVAMCVAGMRLFVTAEGCVLAAGSACVLMVADVVFSAEGVISPVYLLDGVLECAFVIAWVTLGILYMKANYQENMPSSGADHLAVAWR